MKLVVFSHKETWADPTSSSGYATIGGFPFQMQALSELFHQTTVMVPVRTSRLPSGARPLTGHNLKVHPLEEPRGADWRRKVSLLAWLPRHLPAMYREALRADAVHTPVPGDIGTIGLLLALALRKPLFVRHCGAWADPQTMADRALFQLLERNAGGKNVVLATGGSDTSPSRRNPAIRWIFSTTLTKTELSSMPAAQIWCPGLPLRLITVGRLSPRKNISSVIRALVRVRRRLPETTLEVVGDGDGLGELRAIAAQLGVTDAVTFHGNVPHEQVVRLLSESHLFVFPTHVKEGFPKAVMEALACGVPVVATGVSVIPKLIGTSNGVVLGRTDPASVAEAILSFVSQEHDWRTVAASCRETSKSFTLEAWRDNIGRLLQEAWGTELRVHG